MFVSGSFTSRLADFINGDSPRTFFHPFPIWFAHFGWCQFLWVHSAQVHVFELCKNELLHEGLLHHAPVVLQGVGQTDLFSQGPGFLAVKNLSTLLLSMIVWKVFQLCCAPVPTLVGLLFPVRFDVPLLFL